jgi:hypothetical protein
MVISKSVLYPIIIISIITSLPFLLMTGMFFIGNIMDLQFDSDMLIEGLFLIPLFIPIVSLVVLTITKMESEKYGKISVILLILNSIILIMGIIGIVNFTLNPFSM